MTSNPPPLRAAENIAHPVASHLSFLAEARSAGVHEGSVGNFMYGGFTRDFATADRERVMVTALTRRQFADLAKTTRLARTFAFLERLLDADFSACGDLYTHRAAIAMLLAPWFARRAVADVAAAFAGTSVSWARLHEPPAAQVPALSRRNEMAADRAIRASDQDRDSAAESLSAAYAVGRLSREELDDRATAAYSARTQGELRDLTADLPRPVARTGLPSETVALRRMRRRADQRLVGEMIWILEFALAAGLAGLVIPPAVWVATVLIPITLLLPPALGISGGKDS